MYIKERPNHYHCSEPSAHRNYPRPSLLDFIFEIGFQSLFAPLLLVGMMAVIGILYSITNGTVSNKYINIFGIV